MGFAQTPEVHMYWVAETLSLLCFCMHVHPVLGCQKPEDETVEIQR